jgi:hypothetical protein
MAQNDSRGRASLCASTDAAIIVNPAGKHAVNDMKPDDNPCAM